ncbi:MAG: AraC family transcriptional regulator, partial [Lachnospiraceae bacterium]|nr:AraC family transcriptional regulator [Lachnospiraceae bacterium]
ILSVEEAMRISGEQGMQQVGSAGDVASTQEDTNDSRGEAVRSYIELHYAEDLSVSVMAEHFGYSEVYFCKIFKQHFGESFVSYLTHYRIREAVRLLEDESVNVKDVGKAVGYEDSNYFTKVFRRVMGMSPSEYRGKN